MATYAWIIDRDYFAEEFGDQKSAVGSCGPSSITSQQMDELQAGDGHKFRLLDDDGNLIAKGRLVGDHESEDAFGPLGDFGAPNWGCTSIEYWYPGKGGGWQQL